MKIYITAPLYYRSEIKPVITEIISFLKKEKHILYSDDLLETPLEEALNTSHKIQSDWFQTWRQYVSRADLAVAEISYPGTGNVGFEVASILTRGKPVIGLYKEGKDPVFISELHTQRLIKVKYTDTASVSDALSWALEEAKQLFTRRFTFFIPPEIDHFLDKLYRDEGITRSEFIRNLINREIKRRTNNK